MSVLLVILFGALVIFNTVSFSSLSNQEDNGLWRFALTCQVACILGLLAFAAGSLFSMAGVLVLVAGCIIVPAIIGSAIASVLILAYILRQLLRGAEFKSIAFILLPGLTMVLSTGIGGTLLYIVIKG